MMHFTIYPSILLCVLSHASAAQYSTNVFEDTYSWVSSLLPGLQKPIFNGQNSLNFHTNITSALTSAKFDASAWTYPPKCMSSGNLTEPVCLYSSHSFGNGRGISIFTTPEQASTILGLPAFSNPQALSDVNVHRTPPFEERELPGRGRGLIANTTLHRGDRIFAHTPILILDAAAYEHSEEERMELNRDAVRNLPSEAEKMFWELHGHFGTDAVDDRINTNAFDVEIEEESFYAVMPEIARLNHDCRPNAAYFFSPTTLTLYVHALTTIPPGTELTITYINALSPRATRLSWLHESWGFPCSCSLCSLPSSLTTASDTRIALAPTLATALEDWSPESKGTPEMALTLISLYEQERLWGWLGGAYASAALAYNAVGDRWGAIRYGHLAVEMGMLDSGFEDEQVEDIGKLVANPEGHWSWMKRSKKSVQEEDLKVENSAKEGK